MDKKKSGVSKKNLRAALIVLAVCMVVFLVYGLTNRSTNREPTQQEIEAYAAYAVDWQAATGVTGSDREIILSLCDYAEEKTVGTNQYKTYTSDTLADYLYNCQELQEIMLVQEEDLGECVYVQYTDGDGRMVILNYGDQGLVELGVYDAEADTFYHDMQGTVEVWEKFRKGFQFGI